LAFISARTSIDAATSFRPSSFCLVFLAIHKENKEFAPTHLVEEVGEEEILHLGTVNVLSNGFQDAANDENVVEHRHASQ